MQLAIAIFSVRLSTPNAVKCICHRRRRCRRRHCDKAGKALNINCMPMCHNFAACTRITTREYRTWHICNTSNSSSPNPHTNTHTHTLFQAPCGVFYFLPAQLQFLLPSSFSSCLPHSLNNQFHAVAFGSILLALTPPQFSQLSRCLFLYPMHREGMQFSRTEIHKKK